MVTDEIKALLVQAEQAYQKAQDALLSPDTNDFDGYLDEIKNLRDRLTKLVKNEFQATELVVQAIGKHFCEL